MKIGLAISAVIITTLIIIVVVKLTPAPADKPSGAITEESLKVQTLPSNLPSFGAVVDGGEVDAEAFFTAATEADREVGVGGGRETDLERSLPLIDLLLSVRGSELSSGFIDRHIPDKRMDSKAVQNAMAGLKKAIDIHIEYNLEEGKFDQATAIGVARLALGQQIFEGNVRLKARQRGLASMKNAINNINLVAYRAKDEGAMSEDEYTEIAAKSKQWFDAISVLEKAWNTKLEKINATGDRLNIADLIIVARQDKDRSFRIFAARRLGYARFERGDKKNAEAINEALAELEKDSDKLVAKAAKSGLAIKDAEEYHELMK